MNMISTRDLVSLPDVPTLRRLTQSLAMLDATPSPEWEGRCYSFHCRWAEGEMMASMRDGSGDEWFLPFTPAGAILKGFAHESPMAVRPAWPGVLSDAPAAFADFLAEPAFSTEGATFCLWRTHGAGRWHRGTIASPPGADPGGSAGLLAIPDRHPRTCQRWAQEYFETGVSPAAVRHVYEHCLLTPEVVTRLNAEVTLDDLADDVAEIGYPAAPG